MLEAEERVASTTASRAELSSSKSRIYPSYLICHVFSPEEAAEVARKMIGHKLITKQTGAAGRPCSKVFVVETVKYKREFYLAILLDRQSKV